MKYMTVLLGLLLLTGCSSNGNVNKRAYVRGAAIDGNTVTMSFYTEEETLSVTAENFDTAKKEAELKIGKQIFTGHTELILLGECNETEVLEYMLHKWKVPPSCRVVTNAADGGEELKNHDTEKLSGAIDIAQEQGKLGKCDIVTVLSEYLN
ncbi:MAG: hypothetical protein K2J37_02595 [Ruminococcus sp.]|nr:hypothetical protein [Ruminococcus sp.]MDE6784997.1 hypothetical protein [Ruminococcus sp.]